MGEEEYLISKVDEFFYYFCDDFICEESFPESYADGFVYISFLWNIG